MCYLDCNPSTSPSSVPISICAPIRAALPRPTLQHLDHPLLPYPFQTRALPTHPQDILLLRVLPHHYHCLPCPAPYLPTPTSDSDVPLAPATIPPAASRHQA